MADVTQSFSQLLLTYGPGAMLDLPDHAVVVSGLQGWDSRGNIKYISEDRLVRLLKSQLGDKLSKNFSGLRQPPELDEDKRGDRAPGVEVMLFPTWFTVDDTSGGAATEATSATDSTTKSRRMVEFSDLTTNSSGRLSYSVQGGKSVDVNPIRFVAACTKGHLQDIDWRYLVHRNGDRNCRKPMYWVERGVSSDPSDISVKCTCKASLTMADLYKPKFLGGCQCDSPWLQPRKIQAEVCDNDLRLLPRSATNTYFAQTVTVISLTKSDDRLQQTIEEHFPTIAPLRSLPNLVQIIRSLPQTKDAFSPFSDDDIIRAIERFGSESDTNSDNPRIAEFDALASGSPFIGHDGSTSHLYAETLTERALGLIEPWRSFLKNVVKIGRAHV